MVEYLQSRAGNVHFFRKWKKGLCCTTLQITDNIGQARKGRENFFEDQSIRGQNQRTMVEIVRRKIQKGEIVGDKCWNMAILQVLHDLGHQ